MGLRIRGQLTVVREAGAADVELLVTWHSDPEVSRYWDDETFTAGEIRERLEREPVDAWIVEEAGEPVGYLQSWCHDDAPSDRGRRGGLDGFLIPAARGRGLMPDAARALTRSLLLDEGWEDVTVDPYAWNERAIRAWAKAGFVEVARRPADGEHRHPWVLMRFGSVPV